jgi:coenzyme F420 biosynthesis associated uncharacterized protein
MVSSGPIDWDAAVRTGQRLVPHGPSVTAREARAAVADLRRLAAVAEQRVRATTGLGEGLPIAEAEVVDRRGWVAATAEGMAALTAPLAERLPPMRSGASVAGSQVGVLLGYLSGRVLGQYDPIGPAGGSGSGRLLLIAPNVIKVERDIGADPSDFRLWVCLHEGTHRLQFTAVPWLTGYFRSLVDEYAKVAPTDASELLSRAVAAVRSRGGGGAEPGGSGDSWIQRIQTPEQRRVFDALMALMTLLEGHADHVMDAVGPSVVPSVAAIRSAFSERRRKGRGPLDRLVRTLLGMDAKLAQYVRGAAFVRGVVGSVGMDGFNAVWSSADTLPTLAEIADPPAWVRRVHG